MQSYKITDVASVRFDSEGPASEVQEARERARETAVFVTIPAGTRPSVRTIDAIDSTGRAVAELQRDLAKAGVVLALVVVPVKHQADLERMGLIDLIGATGFSILVMPVWRLATWKCLLGVRLPLESTRVAESKWSPL